MLEVLLRHLEYITAVCKEHVAAVLVLCHVLILALLKLLKLHGVVRVYPASLVQMYRFPTALGSVLVFEAYCMTSN